MIAQSMEELIGLGLACGAAGVGGPLTSAEEEVARTAAPVPPSRVAEVCAAIRNGADPLGEAFCELRSPLDRRPLGAYYTGTAIARPMVDWVLAQRPDRVIDPGCGSGRFLVATYRQNPKVDLVAVDLDPIATLLTRAALAALRVTNARVFHADYLTVDIPRHTGRTAFIGNPPYVRHHDLTPATKALATTLAHKVGHRVSGLAGLHALFYLATLAKHGAKGDVGSFVTSAEWLDVGYGSVIRAMFSNGLGGRSLTVMDPQSIPFADAMTTAAITTFRIGEDPPTAQIARIVDAVDIVLEHAATGMDVQRTILIEAKRWSPLLHQNPEIEQHHIGKLFRVARGQVTGANWFFTMTRKEAKDRGIERFCVPLISSADDVFAANGVVHDTPDRLVGLEIPKDTRIKRFPRLYAYLEQGEAEGVHEGYVASHRNPWWAVSYPRPPIVATYMARQAPKFAANPDRLGLLNVVHGLHPLAYVDADVVTRVVDTLNANRATFVGRGRTYHGGLEKFEPTEMANLPLSLAACS